MDFLSEYMSEIALGGSGAVGTLVITLMKRLVGRIDKVEKRCSDLESELKVNTALDKERQRR